MNNQSDGPTYLNDASDQHVSASATTRRSAGPTSGHEKARPTAGVIIARLLAVLVVVMVVTSIVGFVVFARHGGNSAAATICLVIGAFSAVLGLIYGFLKAYQQ